MQKHFYLVLFLFFNTWHAFAQCSDVPAVEAVVNGDFEDGNDGSHSFGSHVPLATFPGYSNPGNYLIDSNVKEGDPNKASTFNAGAFDGIYDHTYGDGTGNFLMIDQHTSDPVAWQQTVDVFENQIYYFSAWITSLINSSPAQLQFQVQGNNDAAPTLLGAAFTAPDKGVWIQIYETWDSGNNTSATLTLINQNTSGSGNDFAIDDISFINSCATVEDGPSPDLGPKRSLCNEGGSLMLDAGVAAQPGYTFSWRKDGNEIPSESGPTLTVSDPGFYSVCLTPGSLCPRSSVVEVTTDFEVEIPDFNLCDPPVVSVSTDLSHSSLGYQWEKDNVEIENAVSASLEISEPGDYSVTISSTNANCPDYTESFTVSTILPPVPDTVDFCPDVDFDLTISGSGEYAWFEEPVGGTALDYGNTYTANLPEGTGDKTFYVEDISRTEYSAGMSSADAIEGQKGASEQDGSMDMIFTAFEAFRLEQVSVRLHFSWAGMSATGTIQLIDNNGNIVEETAPMTHTPADFGGDTDPWIEVPLGWNITPGTGYRLRLTGTLQAHWIPTATPGFPFNDNGITRLQYSGAMGDHGADAYYFFYDWVVSQGMGCGRIPVYARENCIQPVQLVEFYATEQMGSVLLHWITSSEINNDYFIVQRTVDGIKFENIGLVQGNGTTTSIHSYTFKDEIPPTGTVYYRIVQYDYNGSYSYSKLIKNSKELAVDVSVWPNPFDTEAEIIVNGFDTEEFSATIFDLSGKDIVTFDGNLNAKYSIGQSIKPGIYLIKIVTGENVLVKKLIKK